jgi:very-short-patch-repair endonuclease
MLDENCPNAVHIRATIAEKITFASQQNDVPVLSDIVIANPTSETYEDLVLELSCEPALVAGKAWKIDRLLPGTELRIKDRQVNLSGALLVELTERVKARLRLTLRRQTETLTEITHNLTGLARNEWGGAAHMPELLAAFVMPNDDAVEKILKDAGERLRKAGEQPVIDGYQSKSRTKVWQITSSIWSAVVARRLVYAEPPASFETQGQKVRTPSDILDGGLATCLDSTLLFAAALEQAGLYPLIALTKGHALCGVWLQPQQLPTLTTEDCTDIRKVIDLQELVLFETTMVVAEPPVNFSKAVAEGTRRVSEEFEGDFVYALDIKQARRRQITPIGLGGSIRAASGAPTGTTSAEVGLEIAPPLPPFDFGITDQIAPDTPATRLDAWRRKLLDLTKRNRLLNLKPSKTAIRLLCGSPAMLEDKLAANKKISVITLAKLGAGARDEGLFHARTGDDFKTKFIQEALDKDQVVADLTQADLDAGLVQLYRKARSDLDEGGANTLYLALGMLKWKLSPEETQTYRAPLILVPVRLERSSAASKVKITQHEDGTVFNMTLLEMLRQDFELRIPLLEGELPKDESGIDVPLIWEVVRKAVREVPGFEVVEDVVLSTFSFAKYLMWKDLADRTEVLKRNNFVKHLIDRPKEQYKGSSTFINANEIDQKIHPADLFMPLPSDSSQVIAVHAAGIGGDFVLEGPPGTGKSQTIANIIAHNLALGKKVLFVAEKMTALNVVYERLKDKGLGDFCLELHSNKANKRDVLNQLGKSWRGRSKLTPTEWQQEADKLEKTKATLNGLVEALHSPGPSGISPRQAIARYAAFPENRLELDWKGDLLQDPITSPQKLQEYAETAHRLGRAFAELSPSEREIFNSISHTEWSNAWQGKLIDLAKQLIQEMDTVIARAKTYANTLGIPERTPALSQIELLANLSQALHGAAKYNLAFAFDPDPAIFERISSALDALRRYTTAKPLVSSQFSDEALKNAPIDAWQSEWAKVQEKIWPLRNIGEFLLSRRIQKTLGMPKPAAIVLDLPQLAVLKLTREELDRKASNLPTEIGWRGTETDADNVNSLLIAGRTLRNAIAGLAVSPDDLINIRERLQRFCISARDMLSPGTLCATQGDELAHIVKQLRETFSGYAKESGSSNDVLEDIPSFRQSLTDIIRIQPRLNAWCQWQTARSNAFGLRLETLIAALENSVVTPENSTKCFQTAYCHWLAMRLIDSRPALKSFSATAHEDLIKEFCRLDDHLAKLATDYIRAKMGTNVPHPDSPTVTGGYKILAHELQKKMRHVPVRKLVDDIGNVLTDLTPCLLMSPLSVAQYLTAGTDLFDLVVFDEASQITVWDAIGAVARGKNVIVVGDPKQMPPSNFFDRSASDGDGTGDEDSGSSEDLESILDEGLAAGVRIHRLTGHYRSRHESLIAFSNYRYYDGDLITYPSSDTKEMAITLKNVHGIYGRGGKGRTNPIEAKAVVAEVVRRLRDPILKEKSIGIVTFNSEQMKLIDDLLDDARQHDPELEAFFEEGDKKEHVVVKNLETVQGHEKDVILLSIGYGPDTPEAKTMPMTFGPLNRQGGERRLNVAITRAKSEMIIFSSFSPSMIDITRTQARAVRDLKHYLEFAERGPVALAEAVTSVGADDQYDSDFEQAVANGLRKMGWIVHTQIGVSKFRIDLGVMHPDHSAKFLAGIECDGAAYHSSATARDRDRIRQTVLENLGWKIIRVWSTDYFIDPETAIRKIHEKLSAALEQDRAMSAAERAREAEEKARSSVEKGDDEPLSEGDAVELASASADNDDGAGSSRPSALTEPTLTVAASFPTSGKLSADRFYDKDYAPVLNSFCCEIIDGIGPITFKHLSEKVARAHDFKRTGQQIKGVLWEIVAKARESSRTPDGHTLIWPEGVSTQRSLSYRGLAVKGHSRDWVDVPYPEKIGAAQAVLSGTGKETAVVALSNLIGVSRLTEKMKAELDKLIVTAEELEPVDLVSEA